MRHIIIGDVHGCLDELKELISKLSINSTDTLYFIGDLIDRGPDSPGVVKYVHSLATQNKLVLILGNHEEKFLRYVIQKKFKKISIKNKSIIENFETILNKIDFEDIKFLSNSYINYNITSLNICLLHGGIPKNNRIDLTFNNKYSPELLKSDKHFELIFKTRFLDKNGLFVSADNNDPNRVFWADLYDGRYGKVIFGHHAMISDNPFEFKNAINVDTGCVFGGYLSACVINLNSSYEFMSIKSKNINN
jgi:serine/threonine protein phosphatase 1